MAIKGGAFFEWGKIGIPILLAGITFWYLSPILPPFILGALLAYVCHPLIKKANKAGMSFSLGACLMTGVAYLVIGTLFLILLPFLREMVILLSRRLADYREEFLSLTEPLFQNLSKEFGPRIHEALGNFWLEATRWITTLAVYFLHNSLALARFSLTLALAPIIGFYFMKDWNVIKARSFALIPLRWRASVRQGVVEIDRSLSHYLRGQIAVCFILALYYSTALWISSLAFGFKVGLLTGLFAFVPYVGFLTGLISSCLLSLFQWGTMSHFVGIILIYLGGAALESVILTPLLVGRSTGIHPLWVIFAVFAGGAIKGIPGIFMALPLATVIAACWRLWRQRYLGSEFYALLPSVQKETESRSRT